jgi:hypothetical protein
MATDLNDLPSLSGGSSAAMLQQALPTDDGQALDGLPINPRIWATAFVASEIVGLGLLCVAAFNFSHLAARYGSLDPSSKLLSLMVLAALYIAIRSATGIYDAVQVFDLTHSARQLALSAGVAFAAILVAHHVPRHSEAHVAIKLCLVTAIALLALSSLKTTVCWAFSRGIAAGRVYVSQAMSIGIGCDPIPSPQIEKLSRNHTRATRAIRLDNARDLAALSRTIAREKIDRVYVSSLWSHAPTVTRYLSALQTSACRSSTLPTGCPKATRPGGELTVYASMTSLGVALDRSGAWLKRAHDVGFAVLALSIASV